MKRNSLGAADRRETLKPKEVTAASGHLAQGFPLGGSVRLWGAGLVKVESHEDIAVFALEKAPPTDWPGWKGGEKQKEKCLHFC